MIRLLSDNWGLKLLSVVIALVVWIFVRVEERSEQILRVSVLYSNLPESLVVVGEQVPQFQLVVEGSRSLLAQIQGGLNPYTIDLGGSSPGIQEFRIDVEKVQLPRGVNVVRIVPSLIEVDLREVQTYRLPVKAILAPDSIADGFEIANVEIEPSIIEISVAKGELDGKEVLRTEMIPMKQRKSDWSGVVAIASDTTHIKSMTTRDVEIFVQVVPKMVERSINDVPIAVRGLDNRYAPRQKTATIKIVGPETLVKRLTVDTVSAYVQVKNPLPAAARLPVFAGLPDQIVLLEIIPAEVVVDGR